MKKRNVIIYIEGRIKKVIPYIEYSKNEKKIVGGDDYAKIGMFGYLFTSFYEWAEYCSKLEKPMSIYNYNLYFLFE